MSIDPRLFDNAVSISIVLYEQSIYEYFMRIYEY
jgi:hypothetical protein